MSIKKKVEEKKKQEKKELEALDPSLNVEGQDIFEIDGTDWDMKMTSVHCKTFISHF